MENFKPKYVFEIRNSSGELLIDITRAIRSCSVKKTRNRADQVTINLDVELIRKIIINTNSNFWDTVGICINELRIKRDDKVIFGGQIMYAENSMFTEARTIEIKAYGWLELLGFAYTSTGVTYLATDAGAIAWGLINTAQSRTNGDYGITQGSITTSVSRDRSYDYANIKDKIIALSEVTGGFDFEVTWDKVFNVYYPKQGSKRTDIVFQYPGNIKQISFERNGLEIANRIIARGGGTGNDAFISTANDTTSQSVFKLREKILTFNDVTKQDTLDEHSAGELSVYKGYYDMPTITVDGNKKPVFGTYNLGDEVKIITNALEIFKPINQYYRIDQMTLTIDDNFNEEVQIQLINIS